jgi:hypothetical protein
MTSSQRRPSLTVSSRSASLWATSRFMSSGMSQPPPPVTRGLRAIAGGALAQLTTGNKLAAPRSRRAPGSHPADMLTVPQTANLIRRG